MDREQLLEQLKKNLWTLAKDKYSEIYPQLQKDMSAYLNESADKLHRWNELATTGSLTHDELVWLLKSQQDLMEMRVLQQAGLSKIKINNIKKAVLNTVLQTLISAI